MSVAQPLAEIARRAWDMRLREPYFRMRVGAPVDRLFANDLSDAEETAATGRDLSRQLQAIDTAGLTATERLTQAFLAHFLGEACEAVARWWETFPVTPYNVGTLVVPLQSVFPALPLRDRADADRHAALLRDYAGMIRAAKHRLAEQARRGWRIPGPALGGARSTIDRLRTLAARTLADDANRIVETEILPAFDDLSGWLGGDYRTAAPDRLGLWQYDGGDEAYDRAIKTHLTLSMTPEALHDIGIEAVERISAEMAELRDRMGGGGEVDFHDRLRRSQRSFAASPEALEATYRRHLDRLEQYLPAYFRRRPQAAHDVQRLGAELEPGMTYGYYQPPLAAGAPGLYRYNGSGLDDRLQLNAAALIFHELVPGHHFHLALQGENAALPPIRREAVDIGVFNEGWAEYASSLGVEMGLYDDDHDRYGRLVHARFAAARLVVDTGLNAFRWTRDAACDYLARQTLESDAQIASEVARYGADMPGQALCYHFGYRAFRDLRRRAEHLAGAGFDVRDFHDAILSEGALPLAVLEAHIDAVFGGAAAR